MNPFLMVSDCRGIKGGAGDSLSPSCSRIEDKRVCPAFWIFASRFSPLKGVYGHITLNTPVLVRSLKLSKVEPC